MLYFETTDNSLLVRGKTFDIKEILKTSYRGRWDPTAHAWALPIELDSDDLRKDLLGAEKAAKKAAKEAAKEVAERAKIRAQEQAAFAATPEGKEVARQQRIADNTARREDDKQRIARGEAPLYWWINCLECEVVDWTRKCTTCDACADVCGFIKNTFRVKGMIRTGD